MQLLRLQVALEPAQVAFAFVSEQATPAPLKPSAGQAAAEPVQFSATSHWLVAERQTVALETKLSAGQALLEPVQVSATSQTPAEARQLVPAAVK